MPANALVTSIIYRKSKIVIQMITKCFNTHRLNSVEHLLLGHLSGCRPAVGYCPLKELRALTCANHFLCGRFILLYTRDLMSHALPGPRVVRFRRERNSMISEQHNLHTSHSLWSRIHRTVEASSSSKLSLHFQL